MPSATECPLCRIPERTSKCPTMCTGGWRTSLPEVARAERIDTLMDLLAQQLADKAGPEKWASVPEAEKVGHRDHARVFLADVLADAAASLAA